MTTRYGKQDARNEVLNLDRYDVNDMLADLGQHRHRNLPLAGATVVKPPPPPDATKFGGKIAKMVEKNENIVAAWGAVYEPEMDEAREDGLGGGQAHRLGPNFRPNQGVLSGRGRGTPARRTRSLSPRRGPGGRGRGIAPGQLGIRMGTRPPKLPSVPKFTPHMKTAGDPAMRHIRPRVKVRAVDDMVAHNFGAAAGLQPKPARPPIKGDAHDSHIGHWWGGRLCVNQDGEAFFSRKQPMGLEASQHAPVPSTPRPLTPKPSVPMHIQKDLHEGRQLRQIPQPNSVDDATKQVSNPFGLEASIHSTNRSGQEAIAPALPAASFSQTSVPPRQISKPPGLESSIHSANRSGHEAIVPALPVPSFSQMSVPPWRISKPPGLETSIHSANRSGQEAIAPALPAASFSQTSVPPRQISKPPGLESSIHSANRSGHEAIVPALPVPSFSQMSVPPWRISKPPGLETSIHSANRSGQEAIAPALPAPSFSQMSVPPWQISKPPGLETSIHSANRIGHEAIAPALPAPSFSQMSVPPWQISKPPGLETSIHSANRIGHEAIAPALPAPSFSQMSVPPWQISKPPGLETSIHSANRSGHEVIVPAPTLLQMSAPPRKASRSPLPPSDDDWVLSPPPVEPPGDRAHPRGRNFKAFLPPGLSTASNTKLLTGPVNDVVSHVARSEGVSSRPSSRLSSHSVLEELEQEPQTEEEIQKRIDQLDECLEFDLVRLETYGNELAATEADVVAVQAKLARLKELAAARENRLSKQMAQAAHRNSERNKLLQRQELIRGAKQLEIEAREKAELEAKEKAEQELRAKKAAEIANEQAAWLIAAAEATKNKQRCGNELLEQARLQKERDEQEHLQKERAEQEHLQKERAEQERLQKERAERERLEQERLQKERAEQERLQKERAEQERLQKERAEQERLQKERAEQERLQKERAEQERLQKERAEQERLQTQFLQRQLFERVEMARIQHKLTAETESQAKSSAIPVVSPVVFPPGKKDPVRDDAAFKAQNPAKGVDAFDPLNPFPLKVKIVVRPVLDRDPLVFDLIHTDQPTQKIKKAVRSLLPTEEADYLLALKAFQNFSGVIVERFWARVQGSM